MAKKIYKVTGMHCPSCAMSIEWELEDKNIKAKCNYAKQTLEIEISADPKALEEEIKKTITSLGYKLLLPSYDSDVDSEIQSLASYH